MKLRLVHCWDVMRLALPLYLNLLHLSLRDLNALCCRAEDRRMKTFRLWIEDGEMQEKQHAFYIESV